MKKAISIFHYLTQDHPVLTHSQLADLACLGGVEWVQLRVKNQSPDALKITALATQEVCKKHGARFIINDHVHLAKEIGADGVHLGKTDMEVEEARSLLGENAIIGTTANTLQEAERITHTSADYIGLGPFRFTLTKEKLSPVLGIEAIQAIALKMVSSGIPIIAIGGIRLEDIEGVFSTGVHGFALSSAVNLNPNPVLATTQFLFAIHQFSKQKANA
jgi:thiamine-phosphate pyrophosphorylase